MLIFLALLAMVTTVAVAPIDTRPLPSLARPAGDYAQALARFDTLARRETDSILPDGASLLLLHGHRTPRALVLVHGLANSPRQFRELARQFHDSGYNVIVPRLPHHGFRDGDVGHLAELTAEELRDCADASVDIAHGLGDTVLVVGLSAGGNIAAWIAQRRPDVKRVVVVSPALALGHIPRLLSAPAMNLMERVPNLTVHQSPDTLRRHAYFGVSSRGLGETLRLGASVVEDADQNAPVVRELIMVVNGHDSSIDAEAALRLADRWSASTSRLTTVYRFDGALGLPHDVIDVSQYCAMPEIVYPVLIALTEARTPPPPARITARCWQ